MTHRWTIDYPEDMKFIKEVYKEFSYRDYFGFEEILDLLKTKPEISKINSKYNGINWYRNEKDNLKTISSTEYRSNLHEIKK